MIETESNVMSGKTTIKGNPSQYVKLNIGGSLHYTTIGTLTKHDTMLRAMFSGRMEVLSDSDGKRYTNNHSVCWYLKAEYSTVYLRNQFCICCNFG